MWKTRGFLGQLCSHIGFSSFLMFYVQFYVSLQEGAVLRVLISYLILLKISIGTGHNWMPLNI